MKEHGIKEIREAMEGLLEVSLFIANLVGDGFQWSDISDVFKKLQDKEFQAILKKAVEGREKIPAEVKDIDFEEAMELAVMLLKYLPRLIKKR